MITVRLFNDGAGKGWAIVRCPHCASVQKFTALDALRGPVRCKCGASLEVRDLLITEMGRIPGIAGGLAALPHAETE
jgi:hypothetical protein